MNNDGELIAITEEKFKPFNDGSSDSDEEVCFEDGADGH